MGVDQTEEYRNIRENRERECQSSGGDDQGRVRSCFDDSPASVFDDVPAEQQKWLAAPFPCENLLFVFISEEKGNRTHHFSVKPGNENSGHSGTSSCADNEENRLSAACLPRSLAASVPLRSSNASSADVRAGVRRRARRAWLESADHCVWIIIQRSVGSRVRSLHFWHCRPLDER